MKGLEFWVLGSGFRIEGLGLRVEKIGLRVWFPECGVKGSR